MDLELYQKIDELFLLLDDLDYIKNICDVKENISENLLNLINEYRYNPTIENKKKLYENDLFLKYIENEAKLNYLIMEINNKFREKRGHCESN